MRRRTRIGLVAAGLAAAVLTAGSVVTSSASTNPARERSKTIAFNMRFSPLFILDLGKKSFSKGDEIVSHDLLFNSDGRRVGHDGIACVVTNPNAPEAACQGTFSLPRGDISVQLLNSPPPVKVGAITGGTGAFREARGSFRLVESAKDQTGTVTFHLIF